MLSTRCILIAFREVFKNFRKTDCSSLKGIKNDLVHLKKDSQTDFYFISEKGKWFNSLLRLKLGELDF
jgi:hypothetical protein